MLIVDQRRPKQGVPLRAGLAPTARRRRAQEGSLRAFIVAARPLQWQKNLLLYAAFLLAGGSAWSWSDPSRWLPALALVTVGVICFNAVSSGSYLINDALDVEHDRLHPRKRHRPIAAGRIPVRVAIYTGATLAGGGVLVAFVLDATFGLITLGYALLVAAYSIRLKHVPVADVTILAGGFGLRVMAGAAVIAVPISPWLVACAMLGALYVAVIKRRQELSLFAGRASAHRAALGRYSDTLLGRMAGLAAAGMVVAYGLLIVTTEHLPGGDAMLLTLPFVLLGAHRYRRSAEHAPERNADEIVLTDRNLQLLLLLCGLTALLVAAVHP